VDPAALRATPSARPIPAPPKTRIPTKSIPAIPTTVPDFIYKQVKADRSRRLEARRIRARDHYQQRSGSHEISLTGSVPGVEVKLDRTVLTRGRRPC